MKSFGPTIVSLGLVAAVGASSASAATFRPASGDPSCEVRLVPARGGVELGAPCGAAVGVPPGDYDVWLEDGAARITPFPTRVSIAENDTREYRLPLEAGGMVSADAHELMRVENAKTRLFRRSAGSTPRQMPAGRAVAVERDERGEPLAVSRPFLVPANAAPTVRSGVRAHATDLLVVLDRPAVEGSVTLAAAIGDERRTPDLLASAADQVVAIWYDLPPGRAEITATSPVFRLEPQWTTVRERRLASIRAALVPLPSLRVTAAIAPEALAKDEKLSLRVLGRTHEDVQPNVPYDFDALPATPVDVELRIGEWTVRRTADLSDGQDQTLAIELEPLVVTGVVTYGDEPADANVGFSAGRLHEARTDAEGRYRIRLWEPRRYAMRVQLRTLAEVPPFVDTVRVHESRELDVKIPRARYRVHVADDANGRPVTNARVTLTSVWEDPAEGRRRVMLQVTTDAGGEALLPPLRTGTVELRADAEGYLTVTSEPRPVSDGEDEVRLDLRMQASGSVSAVKIVLPAGTPAVGAEWIAVRDGRVILHATVPEDGTLEIPKALEGALLVLRHPEGTGLRVWRSEGEPTWQLLPVAPPVTIEAVDGRGRAAGSTPIVVWTAGHRLSGIALAFLVGSGDATSIDGTWTGRNLPAAPMTVLIAKRGTAAAAIESGAFDALAQHVPYPWAGIVRVGVAE